MVSRKMVKKIDVSFIPDDLVLEIVSRLSAEDVHRCRSVCRRWKDVTSSKKFLGLHRRREGIFPLILVERKMLRQRFEHFLLDKWWEPGRTRSRLQKFPMYAEYKVQFCDDGLIVLKQTLQTPSRGNYMVLNPINGENVKFSISIAVGKIQILGLFFHPSLKEYCTLWIMTDPLEQLTPPGNPDRKEYKFLNLGPNPCWRNIKSPVGHKAKFLSTKAVSVDKYLYWMVDDDQDVQDMPYVSNVGRARNKIIEFDVNGEELTLITSPANYSIFSVNLFNNGGVLSMVEVYPCHPPRVAISSLTDRPRQLWTTTNISIKNGIFKLPDPIALADKQLLIFSHGSDGTGMLFVCNLETGTIKKFGRTLNSRSYVFSHVMSLASLKGCKSEFCMGYMGEEKGDAQWFRALRKPSLESKCSVGLDPARNEEGSTSNGKTSENEAAHIPWKA